MSAIDLKPTPFVTYGLLPGAANARESALLFQKNMTAQQSSLNKIGGKRRYHKKGGAIVIPQFPILGPSVSPVDANSTSVTGNKTFINAMNDGTNDCYATNSCIKGGRHSKKRSTSKRKSSKCKRSSMKRKTRNYSTKKYRKMSKK